MTLSRPDNFDADEQSPHHGAAGITDLSIDQSALPTEFSGLLETSVPLEAPIVRYVVVPEATSGVTPESMPKATQYSETASIAQSEQIEQIERQDADQLNRLNEIVVPLLGERLVVDRQRRKVGEVIVRKEIETQIVEVPIRREKLIVEQVSPEYQQLAVVELGQTQASLDHNFQFSNGNSSNQTAQSAIVSGEFASVDEAIQFLTAIAAESRPGLQKVQVKVVLEDETLRATYQRWLAQHSTEPLPQ